MLKQPMSTERPKAFCDCDLKQEDYEEKIRRSIPSLAASRNGVDDFGLRLLSALTDAAHNFPTGTRVAVAFDNGFEYPGYISHVNANGREIHFDDGDSLTFVCDDLRCFATPVIAPRLGESVCVYDQSRGRWFGTVTAWSRTGKWRLNPDTRVDFKPNVDFTKTMWAY